MPKKAIIIVVLLLATFLAVFALPLSNFFLKREPIEANAGVPQFKAVSKMMQSKCADCHTPGMMVKPVYASFPFASQLIGDDVKTAQQQIVFSKEHLSGLKPFTKVEAAKIQTVVENNEMPILPYKLMHWDSGITTADKEAVLAWIQAQFARENQTGSTQ